MATTEEKTDSGIRGVGFVGIGCGAKSARAGAPVGGAPREGQNISQHELPSVGTSHGNNRLLAADSGATTEK
jgi:hypothetical protein